MKKWMIVLGITLIMGGCSAAGKNNSNSSSSSASSIIEENSKVSSIESESSNKMSSDQSNDSSKFEGAGTGSILEKSEGKSSTKAEKSNGEIPLVPQKSDIENGFTLETDPVLQGIEERMRQAETIGIPNDVAIHFTGMTLNETDKTQAIFILVNLTTMTMTDINMSISFSNTANEVILDKLPLSLTEERFGVLEPNTAMPLYIDIPKESEEIFYNLKDFNEMVYSIDSFDYKEI